MAPQNETGRCPHFRFRQQPALLTALLLLERFDVIARALEPHFFQ
jgi:hypothetical protein